MKNEIISEFLTEFLSQNLNFADLTTGCLNFNYYQRQKEELRRRKQLSYHEIIAKITRSSLINLFLNSMDNINEDVLYKSEIHGLNHNIKVCILTYIICVFEGVDEDVLNLSLTAAKYHDIGRINDLEDGAHGIRGAKKLNFLKDNFNEEEFNILKTAITCHSLQDSEFKNIAKQNKVSDMKKCRLVFKILKDADGLDRVRLDYPYIEEDFLRLKTSKHLILFSYQLNENYTQYFKFKTLKN